MEPWRYFWTFVLYVLLVSEHTGSQVTFTSPEAPGGTQDLTDFSPPESESDTSQEPETRLPSGWISPMATTEMVSEVGTSAAMMADTYETLSGQLHPLPLESSTPNAEGPSQETTFFQATNAPADESRSTDSLSFAEASSAPPGAASIAPSPPPSKGYTHFIHRRSIPTRKSSSGFRPPGTSMVKKGSTSAYLLSSQDPTGRMSHSIHSNSIPARKHSAGFRPSGTSMVKEEPTSSPQGSTGQVSNMATTELVSKSATMLADTYEGHLHSLPLESSTPNAESPSQETTFFQDTSE